MKFRYKVLFINIILLSLGIGVVGYLMIRNNFSLALEAQVRNAIEENNMVQSAIEYELLDVLNSNFRDLTSQLEGISQNVIAGMSANQSDIYVIYNGDLYATNSSTENSYPEELITNAQMGKKHYVILEEGQEHFIYVTSCNTIQEKNLNIINKRNISSIYDMMMAQQNYFRILLLFVILICSVGMYVISLLLTKPLEQLSQVSASFGKGDYSARADIHTGDEIEDLALTYNQMAGEVAAHIEELKQMVIRQEQFVADFTHEMKTPMTTIIGYADMIRSKELSKDTLMTASSYIFSEGKRLEAMSMKLFDFIYTKQHEIEKMELSTKRLMDNIINSVSPSLNMKNITLEHTCDEHIMKGDMALLTSAFINLIDNARKASTEGAHITFSGQKIEAGYLFTVQDFGVGIPEEHLKRICDEFYMVDKSRSRKEGGAGLGLSLASLIFQSHNAKMDIVSSPGEGTTITIFFSDSKEKGC